ncbi:MAG: hypothetical protein Q4G14_03705 [Paracoccus sp. (in: a-proteobacteria)]|uniref:hypothetical protein n=1 Tax=Paracoccus sp. TaxID=267 RepID=UPI0026DFBE31|nr:hypothetical protein [Paracoccus sp. (in: a-proteobacteria)]MDO5612332.1 hypothetical protein [Paracoccus sp. (in: a-proteobacteria)]
MKALHILLHSWRQVTGNLEQALRISALPILAQILLILAALIIGGMPQAGGFGTFLALALIWLVATAVMAVNWHRYVLLNEPQSAIPALRGQPLSGYILTMLKIAILMLPAMFAGAMVLAMVMGLAWRPDDDPQLMRVLMRIFGLVVALLFMRLSVALPGAAVGAAAPLKTAWAATRGTTGTLLVLTLVLYGLQWVAEWVFNTLAYMVLAGAMPGAAILLTVLAVAGAWLFTFLSLSVITTLYGHYVEGRDLR